MFRHGPVSGLMTPEKLSKPVPVETTAMERLEMEMNVPGLYGIPGHTPTR